MILPCLCVWQYRHIKAGKREERGYEAGGGKTAALQERRCGIGESEAVEGENFESVQICTPSRQGV